MKKVILLSLGFFLISQTDAPAQGIFQKVVGKIAKVSGKAMGSTMGMFGSVDNLETTAPNVIYRTHVYPKKVGALEVDFFGKGWQDGADALMIQIVDKRGIKMSKLADGSVTVDGKPATFQDLGVYTYFADRSDAAHTIELTAKNGQKSTFTIAPQKAQTRIVSINGQSGEEISIDFTKDLVLELQNPGSDDGALIQVTFTAAIVGLNTFYEIGNFKPAEKIVIPAEAIANSGFPSTKENGPNVKPTYLQIARISRDKPTNVSGVFKNITYINAACDGRWVKTTKKPELTGGLVASGKSTLEKDISYEFRKDEADLSRPFSHAKKIAIAGLGTRGVNHSEEHDSGRMTGVETWTWANFDPSDAFLDQINQKLNLTVTKSAQNLFNAQIVPIEKVAATTAYKESNFMAEAEGADKETYSQPFKSDKIISDAALQLNGFRLVPDAKSIAEETGADALLRCVMDLSLSLEDGKTYLTPVINYSLIGNYNGPAGIVPTKFAEGKVVSKKIKFHEKMTESEVMPLLNLEEMMKMLEAGLADLVAKEKASGVYERIWGMQ